MIQLLRILQSSPVFAIEYFAGAQMALFASKILNREASFSAQEFGIVAAARPQKHIVNSEKTGKLIGTVASYPIHGLMLAQDKICGPAGMNTMANHMYELAEDPNIDAVVFDQQTPGGSIIGLDNFAQAVAYLRSKKPVVTYVNGMSGSAGVRIAVESDEILMGGQTAQFGSIGVMVNYLDESKKKENEGVREVQIVSNYSPDKNKYKLYGEQTEEDIALIQKEILDPQAIQFQNAVKSRREGVDEKALTGNMFLAKEAKKLGLVDGISSYHGAIELAAQLARRRSRNSHQSPQATKKDMGLFSANDKQEQAAHQVELDTQKATFDKQIAELKEAHVEETGKLNTQLVSAQSEIEDLKATIEKLKKAPVTEVSDQKGDEGIEEADATQKVPVASWNNPIQMAKLAERKKELGL